MNSSDSSFDEDTWVFVADTVSKIAPPLSNDEKDQTNTMMTISWIASPSSNGSDQPSSMDRASPPATHHFNPIENLLIEHASMSVYEQIASRTRPRRQRKTNLNSKLEEQASNIREDADEAEDDEHNDDEDDEDDRSSVVSHYPSENPILSSIYHRTPSASLNQSTNSNIGALESSTSSLAAHQRHLQRIHQRRRRPAKASSKLAQTNNIDEARLNNVNKMCDRQRITLGRSQKLVLHQPFRSNH